MFGRREKFSFFGGIEFSIAHCVFESLMLYNVYNALHICAREDKRWNLAIHQTVFVFVFEHMYVQCTIHVRGADRWNWPIHQTVSDCKYCPIIANISLICWFAHIQNTKYKHNYKYSPTIENISKIIRHYSYSIDSPFKSQINMAITHHHHLISEYDDDVIFL